MMVNEHLHIKNIKQYRNLIENVYSSNSTLTSITKRVVGFQDLQSIIMGQQHMDKERDTRGSFL